MQTVICGCVCMQTEELEALFDIVESESDALNAAPKFTVKAVDAVPGVGPIRALISAPPPSRLLTAEPTGVVVSRNTRPHVFGPPQELKGCA